MNNYIHTFFSFFCQSHVEVGKNSFKFTCITALKKHVFPKLVIPLTGTDARLEQLPFPFNTSLASLFSSCSHIMFDGEPIRKKVILATSTLDKRLP